MTSISSISAGDWSSTATWDTASVPTAGDDVTLLHRVTVSGDIYAKSVTIGSTGQLVGVPPLSGGRLSAYTVDVAGWSLVGIVGDRREVRLRGARFIERNARCISCAHAQIGPMLPTGTLAFPNDGSRTMSDPGMMNTVATTEDQRGQGDQESGTEWRLNNPQYTEVTLRWRRTDTEAVAEHLRRMCGAIPVMLFTGSVLVKGVIEQVQYTDTTGSDFYQCSVRVTEGKL